ncbi:unnamed protein product [marine sediment metagenome]|uniref:Tyr recombinase domain-containing protein n=1 Tax=marine sediment metagenome TaxID=412755 RepID=X1VLB2_9ZZZZ
MRLPPPGDQEEFYHALLQGAREESEQAVIMLLWRTGMHASTLCQQTFDFHVDGGIIWCRPKTKRSMRATMPDADIKLVQRVINAGLLPATTRTLARWVQRIGLRAGHSGVCPLTLRHSRAIWLLDQQMPVNRVASLLGCSYAVLEKHYAQIEAARLIE